MKIQAGIISLFFSLMVFGQNNAKNCENESVVFFDNFGDFLNGTSAEEKSFQISAACRELMKDKSYSKVKKDDLLTKITYFKPYEFLLNHQKNELKKKFSKHLTEVVQIVKRNDRVKAAYQLATTAFSEFEMLSLNTLSKKVELKDRSAQRAAILALVLAGARQKKSDYDVKLFLLQTKINEIRRSWVRVSFLNDNGKMTEIDFDPSITGVQPLPLFPLYNEINDRKTLQTMCERVRICLLDSSKNYKKAI